MLVIYKLFIVVLSFCYGIHLVNSNVMESTEQRLGDRIDYCTQPYNKPPVGNKTGTQYCNEHQDIRGDCMIDVPNNSFKCTCPKVYIYYWESDDTVMDCKQLPKCLAKSCDNVSEDCMEPTIIGGEATCVAKRGYYTDPTTHQTIKIDICNPVDRKLAKMAKEQPCDDPRATCQHDFLDPTKYTCRCPIGFESSTTANSSATTCSSRKCDSPALNTCQHKCETDDVDEMGGDHNTYVRGYKCRCGEPYVPVGDTCVLKAGKPCVKCAGIQNCYCDNDGNPHCAQGFEWTQVNNVKKCEMPDILGAYCLGGKLGAPDATGRRYCQCDAPYATTADKTACILQGVCGRGGAGRTDCDAKRAICVLKEPKSVTDHPYVCECPDGTIMEDMYKSCQPVCSYKNRNLACNRINADCDPNIPYRATETIQDYCVCRPGLMFSNGKCVATELTVKFTLSIKNVLPFRPLEAPVQQPFNLVEYTKSPMQDWTGIYNDIQSTNAMNWALYERAIGDKRTAYQRDEIQSEVLRLLAGVNGFDQTPGAFRLKECTSGEYLSCVFTAVIKKGVDYKQIKLGQYLANICHSLSSIGDLKDCFVTVPKTKYPERLLFVTNEIRQTQLTVLKGCDTSRNQCPLYSTCMDDRENSLYSCLCKPFNSFNTTNRIPLEVYNSPHVYDHYIETCDVLPLCKNKCTANGKCYISVEKKVDYTYEAMAICVCYRGFTYDGTGMCIDNCEGYDCTGHGKSVMLPDGRCICTQCL